jgi:hypothetical protein
VIKTKTTTTTAVHFSIIKCAGVTAIRPEI